MNDLTVLFVDDERNVLSALERLLLREPFKKKFAISGAKALELLQKEPAHIIVTDMRMPGMDGVTFLKIVKEQYPDAIRIALSAYTALPQVLAAINTGEVYRYLTKPLNPPEEIIAVLRQAMELYNLRREQRELLARLEEREHQLEKILCPVCKAKLEKEES